jgi:hypothetical protein
MNGEIQCFYYVFTRLILAWRYRLISAFGRSTIRKFSNDVSAIKKLAGFNFEDLLQVCSNVLLSSISQCNIFECQCAMPCFEGLFPQSCEKTILDLLFMLATWHVLAKLRLHTTSSLSFFEQCTKQFGKVIRYFNDHICPRYRTHDTPQEAAAKSHRDAARTAKNGADKGDPNSKKKSSEQTFSLETYKLHALGHYPAMIRQFGTTDSYSTQTVWHSYIS